MYSVKILPDAKEKNKRRLLKSVQNHEILINNISINIPDNFMNVFFIE